MIPIEKQVTSLEPSKRLKEFGVGQISWLYWHVTKEGGIQLTDSRVFRPCFAEHKYIETKDRYVTGGDIEVYSAFTVAELGLLLPQYVESYRIATDQFASKFCELKEDKKGNPIHGKPIIKTSNTEADARAKMLIWLIENKMVGAKEDV